jgi:hypothetical protein
MVFVVLVVLGVTLAAGLIMIPEIEQQIALADKELQQQMGICVVGAGGPCNDDNNYGHTH